MATVCAGCSTIYQLGSLTDEQPEYTGSIGKAADSKAPAAKAEPKRAQKPEAAPEVAELPPDADLAYARMAAVDVLARGGKHASQSWENPRSGARGTVTPLATAYRVDGMLCRDFLASYVADGSESWLQGEACRAGNKGKWEVRRLKPWRT
jgi:hypothetical protein